MRRAVTAFLLFLAAAGPAYPQSVVDLAGRLAQGQDAYPVLQAAADAVPPGQAALIRVPPGGFLLSHPVVADANSVRFAGAGRDVTVLWSPAGPAFAFGLRRKPDLTDDHFVPTALDPTAAGRVGFATRGDAVIQVANQPLCWGGRAALDPGVADHWAELRGYTASVAFDPQGASFALAAMAKYAGDTRPFGLYVTQNGNGRASLVVYYVLAGDPPNAARRAWMDIPAAGLSRADVVWDFNARRLSARLNGRPAGLGGQTDLPAGFVRSRGEYPLSFGYDNLAPTATPAWTLYGYMGCAGVAADPGNDNARYFDPNRPGCVGYFEGRKDPVCPRLVPFAAVGPGNAVTRAYGWAFSPATLVGNFVSQNGLADMTVTGSPAVLVGQVGYFRAERCTFRGGTFGVASQPCAISYPVTFRDCDFSGTEGGISWTYGANVTLDACNVTSAGNVYGRFVATSFTWRDGFFGFLSQNMMSGLEILRTPLGAISVGLRDLCFDDEWPVFRESVVYCQDNEVYPLTLDLSNVVAGGLGPGAVFLKLESVPWAARPAYVRASGLSVSGGGAGAVQVGSPNWSGDLSGVIVPGPPVAGPGAANVRSR